MKLPDKPQQVFANIQLLEPTLHYLRDYVLNSEFDDLELLSHLDKARLSLKCALVRMQKISEEKEEQNGHC